MSRHKIRFERREQVAEGTVAFHFQKPDSFQFRAGQYVSLTLIDPPENDDKGSTRPFSLSSAPYETDLVVTTRMRNTAFKRVLQELPSGSEVSLAGPFGSFTLRQTERPAVFLAGGIGITPFRSMLLQALHDKRPGRLFLFYSNRRPEDAAFLEELIELERTASNFRLVETMTRMKESRRNWEGETGYINRELLARHGVLAKQEDGLSRTLYYAAGPPRLVDAMRRMLFEAGISEDNVISEEFPGY